MAAAATLFCICFVSFHIFFIHLPSSFVSLHGFIAQEMRTALGLEFHTFDSHTELYLLFHSAGSLLAALLLWFDKGMLLN